MKKIFIPLVLCSITLTGCPQSNTAKQNTGNKSAIKVGGGCEGCEAIYESPVPFDKLKSTDTLPDFNDAGPRIEIGGIVYQPDGKTPAPDIIIYVYHTDQTGVYPTKGNEKGWGKRHGYLRGWVKTNEKGQYKFFTLKPAAYPGRKDPAHIHVTVKEPDKNEYWIDEYLFDDDPLLTQAMRNRNENRGGDGILKTTTTGSILKAERNIYLGKNIPGYPKK